MKNLKTILIVALLFISYSTFAQTTIWVVRHAEKGTTPANDPDLTTEGKARATELAKLLKDQKIAAVFSTPYKRTTQTGEPTAKQAGLSAVKNYDPADLPTFARQTLSQYIGKTILIVGHSNTVIPTIQAFGAEKPFATLDDEDYDHLFKVTLDDNDKATVEVLRYGVPHHSSKAVPENKMH